MLNPIYYIDFPISLSFSHQDQEAGSLRMHKQVVKIADSRLACRNPLTGRSFCFMLWVLGIGRRLLGVSCRSGGEGCMERKRAYEPGDMVEAQGAIKGLVIAPNKVSEVRARFREGRRPGSHFAPGCCHVLDYTTQVPVLFEDGTYNVMRGLGIRRVKDEDLHKKVEIEALLRGVE
jgi:hypothetical protein